MIQDHIMLMKPPDPLIMVSFQDNPLLKEMSLDQHLIGIQTFQTILILQGILIIITIQGIMWQTQHLITASLADPVHSVHHKGGSIDIIGTMIVFINLNSI